MKSLPDLLHPEFNDVFEDTKTPRSGRPALTGALVEFMLGSKFDNFVMYDCNAGKLNRNTYNNYAIMGGRTIKRMMPVFKKICEQSSVIRPRIPMAIVAQTCRIADNGMLFYSRRGNDISGNVIFYNPETLRYSVLPGGWMYCGGRACDIAASEEVMLATVKYMIEHPEKLERYAQLQQNTK